MNDIENLGINSAVGIGSKMPHSHSTPAGVDGGSRTPPATPRKAGKMLAVRVQMLDDTVTMFQVQAKALGRVLFDQVCKQLNLLEADYFGLEYQELNGTKYWLDLEKPVCRQVGLTLVDPLLRFCVKFYTPDPAQLEEEFTRYLYCLQIKRDLAQGSLQCNDNTAALMASYIVQAECGDYVIEDYPDHTYLSTYKFVPHQDVELERRIMENHKKHAGQSPAEADLNLLETARRCELYGMKMHSAKDHEGVPLNLAVAHMGIVVFQNYTKINTFSWAKIRKISFKRKRFLIKLHPEGYGYYKDTVEFFFEGRNECKNFWKKCVENHGFFRCSTVKHVVRQKTRVLSRGSSFRYSGKTQKQIVEFVRDNYVKRQTFHRSNSFRQTSGGRALQGSEGGGYRGATPSSSLMGSSSISAHPLLPLGDPVLGTPALSLSCGSMTLDSPTTATSVSMGGMTDHRHEDTATSFRTLTSIDIHSPATPSPAPAPLHHLHASSQQRISTTGRISPSNSSPLEFPPPRPLPRHPWQRSASCRDLYASSFEDSGKSRSRNGKNSTNLPLEPFQLPSQGELDKPVTRYDETNRSYSAASSKLPSLDHDPIPDKVYSSSYPGTSSLSTESGHEESGPAGDLSHDDLSHDSYELLEREHEFEYPESDSSPRDEPASENSDEGIEHELFKMDSETDAFVKHKSVKSSDRQHFKSILADIKCMKQIASDWYPAALKSESEVVPTESKSQRSHTQVHRKFETMHVDVDSPDQQDVNIVQHFDPIITQVQKQKVNLLNELRNLKQKTKITHVDSEVLRDEGIMRPRSRIDDDLSPVDQDKHTLGRGTRRTTRAKSIASLDDRSPRLHIETGSLGRGHRSRERKTRETEAKMEKLLSKMQEKERRSLEKEERKRIERENSREARRLEKSDSRERRSMDRLDSHVRKSMERLDIREHSRRRDSKDRSGSRESRKSSERLDCIERNYERVDSIERNRESRHISIERLDFQELHNCVESVDNTSSLRSFKDKRPLNRDAKDPEAGTLGLHLDSREACRMHATNRIDYNQRHTLERFDSGNRSPFEWLGFREPRGKSVERLDSPGHQLAFDFDIKAIECLRSHDRSLLDRSDSKDRHREMKSLERQSSKERSHIERKSLEKIDLRELRSVDYSNARDKKCPEQFEKENNELRGSADTLDTRESKKGKVTNADRNPPERGKSEDKPRERDDWKSLEKARKDDERRERERQAVLTSQLLEFCAESAAGISEEKTKGSVFAEYDPMIVGGVVLGFDDTTLPIHNPVERTKSDPNPARQRLGSNSKRHMLTHQKSIDLTPADSGDEDAFLEGTRTQKCNVDIPYTLHKRHVMNGTASDEKSESENGKTSRNGVKNLAKDLLNLPLKSVADSSSLDVTKLIAFEEGAALSPERPKSILISPDRVKPRSSISGKNKSISSPVSKFSSTDQKVVVSNTTPADKSPLKSGTKLSPNSQASPRSLSLDIIDTKPVTKDRLSVNSKSTSLDKKSSKLLSTEPNVKVVSSIDKKSYKLSPTECHLAIVSAVEKRKSPVRVPKSPNLGKLCDPTAFPEPTQPEQQPGTKLMDIVGLQIKQKLERREREKLNVPSDSLEKHDSIENVPLPEIPLKIVDSVEPPLPITQRFTEELGKPDNQVVLPQQNLVVQSVCVDQSPRATMEIISSECEENGKQGVEKVETERLVKVLETESSLTDKSKLLEKSRLLQKPSIPEKTKRILDKIESRFTEINKNSTSKVSKPMIIDTGFDDFVDPIADLPLDEVPVKPALDSLKVPEFTPFISRPHAEPLRCKSLSLAEEKAHIDTLLSPELESKSFVQDISPKKSRLTKSDAKKDFKKQSKSLEGDKPSFKKTASKELKTSPANSKVGKSKLKIGEMPQEIIIIDSTDVEPEISIVQKGRSKSVTRLAERSFSNSKDEKDEFKKSRVKSTSVDDDLIKGPGNSKNDKPRPKFLGISKSLGSTEKKDSIEKVSPKRVSSVKSTSKSDYCQGVRSMKSETDMPRPVVNNEVRAALINSEAKSVTDVGEGKTLSENSLKKYQNNQEMCQSSTIMRKPGQVPILFARARLGLSEGSGLGALQRQGATQSPTAQRRAKSLDAPVISVHRLPPVNAYSSKDDTVDTTEELAEHEIVSDENLESHQMLKSLQSVQMEASPNHKSESTDHTTIPEMLTDSLSVTETSAQYLESPLTECNEIVICPDLIPYEQESQVQSVHLYNSREIPLSDRKIDNLSSATKFIDQSSIESGAEVENLQESAQPKGLSSGNDVFVSNMPYLDKYPASIFEINSKTEFFSGSDSWDTGARDWKHEKQTSPQHYKNGACNSDALSENMQETNDTSLKMQTVKAHSPYTESTSGIPNMKCTADAEKNEFIADILEYSPDPNTGTVKPYIQISIEECSDDEIVTEPENDVASDVIDINRRKSRLDSGDTSEDTLDALESQVRGGDSEVSSPDYGVEKVDEKTLVEVQLTPEYLEMKKEDEKAIEELPEDEQFPTEIKEVTDPNRLPIERKLRLSTERSGSEETNTWTPDREDPDSSSCSIARPLGIGRVQPILDRREIAIMKETRRDGSQEEESSSSSFPIPKPELSSTWKPFPLESSGSSSFEDGWFPPDDSSNHHQSHSEDSNGQNEDSFQEDLIDFPAGFGYPIGSDILANYGGAFCLSRTLSRISERSTTSEQDKSEVEDSFKPSSRSPSLDDESLISSDHQPSLSSDPPSGTALPSVSDDRRTSSELPDIPIDVINGQEDEGRSPKVKSRLQLQASEEWPSPPSSPLFDTPVVSHVETFYMEIKPEEAVKVTVNDSTDTPDNIGNDTDSSDENRTLHDDLHSTILEDGQSSMSATTVDGTVKITVKPKSNSYITGSSHSEDTSMGLSMSEWSSSNNTVRQFCQYSGTKSDDNSLAELGASISDWSGSTTIVPQQYYATAATEKSQSDTTTSDKSITSMRPNSRCRHVDSSLAEKGDIADLDVVRFGKKQQQQQSQLERQDFDRCQFADVSYGDAIEFDDSMSCSEVRNYEAAQFDEARKFVESQFDKHQFDDSQYEETHIPRPIFTDISPPQITFQNEYDESVREFEDMTDLAEITDIPRPIPEESEEQLYDNVPAMKYSSGDQVRMEVTRGDSSEDMHERYASLASRTRYEYDRSIDDQQTFEEKLQKRFHEKSFNKFERGYSEPGIELKHGTKSTQRPVIVPIRAKSTPYYSTTSLSGESTTSSPPMQVKTQIRTKTMAYSSSRSPQSEGDTSSSMDSPGHTPERGARAFRRKRQQNIKRRHRVAVDLELKDEQIVSSTDSSFDVANIPPPLLPEQTLDIDDEELFVTGNKRHHRERNPE